MNHDSYLMSSLDLAFGDFLRFMYLLCSFFYSVWFLVYVVFFSCYITLFLTIILLYS